MTLTIIIEVIGTNIIPRSLSERISPGNLPNQLNTHGAKCIITPSANIPKPANIIQRAITTLNNSIVNYYFTNNIYCY